MRKCMLGAVVGLTLLASQRAIAQTTVLYDGTKSTLPTPQGWLNFTSQPAGATQTLAAGSVGPTTLDTTSSVALEAGYSNCVAPMALGATSLAYYNTSFPTLAPTTGFDLTFNMKLDSESHPGSTNRSGFSVILLGSDDNGVELGFWQGSVWAQSTTFTRTSEISTSFDPTTGFYQYDLHIQGSTYSLSANGTQILTGSTRSYSSTANSTLPYPLELPYDTPNFVFLGDDTQAAQAVAEIQSVAISVPEPTCGILMIGMAGLLLGRRRPRMKVS